MVTQKQLTEHLTKDFLTIRKIAEIYKVTPQALYKTINKLKKKGVLKGSQLGGFNLCTHYPMGGLNKDKIRLHGGEFKIYLREETKHRKRIFNLSKARIHVYRKSILVWGSNIEFYGKDTAEALKQAQEFYHILFSRLETRLNLDFYKEGYLNIEQVQNFHVESINCNFAKTVYKNEANTIKIRSPIDGKARIVFDKSKGLKNTEAIHPETSTQDAEVIFDKIFNDYLTKECFSPKECTDAIGSLAHSSKAYIENIQKHLAVLDKMAETMDAIQKGLNKGGFRYGKE